MDAQPGVVLLLNIRCIGLLTAKSNAPHGSATVVCHRAICRGLSKGFEHTHLVLKESIPGQKLSEGDAPAGFLVNYEGLWQYSKNWRDMRAYTEDSAGGKYVSKKLPKSDIPSLVK